MDSAASLFFPILTAVILRVASLLSPSSDDVIHLWNIQFRRRHGNLRSQTLLDGVFEGQRGYPTLVHGIIALFPRRIWKPVGLAMNVLWDLVVIVLAWCLLSRIGGRDIGDLSPATCAGLLIATCPLLVPVNPRMRSLGARTFGGLLCFVYFLALGYGVTSTPWLGGGVCVVFGLLIIASSQFAIQVMVLVSLVLAVLYLHWLPVAVLAAVGLIAWYVPVLGLRAILRFRKAHMGWYFRNQRVHGTAPVMRNRLRDHLLFPIDVLFRPRKALVLIFFHSSYLSLLVTLPMLTAGVILWGLQGFPSALLDDPVRHFAAMMVLATTVVFILTSLRWFLFLGEAERYFEYSVPFLAFLYVYLTGQSSYADDWLWGMLVVQVCVCLLQFVIARRDAQRAGRQGNICTQREELRKFITQSQPHRIVTLPIKDAFELSSWSDGRHRFFYRGVVRPEDTKGFGYMDEECATLSYPRTDLEYYRQRYNVDWVVFEKGLLAEAIAEGLDYRLEQRPIVWENDGHLIVSLTDRKEGPDHAS